jgi:hypothetical protein
VSSRTVTPSCRQSSRCIQLNIIHFRWWRSEEYVHLSASQHVIMALDNCILKFVTRITLFKFCRGVRMGSFFVRRSLVARCIGPGYYTGLGHFVERGLARERDVAWKTCQGANLSATNSTRLHLTFDRIWVVGHQSPELWTAYRHIWMALCMREELSRGTHFDLKQMQ